MKWFCRNFIHISLNHLIMKSIKHLLFVPLLIVFGSVVFAQNEIKSPNLIMQRLDSIVYAHSARKVDYTYDAKGIQLINSTEYIWNTPTMRFAKQYKTDYSYDINGNCISTIKYYWSNSQTKWIYESKSEKQFDKNGNCVLDNYFGWNNIWVLNVKDEITNTYDAYNNLLSSEKYIIDRNSTLSSLSYKDDFSYNSDGTISSKKMYRKNQNDMDALSQTDCIYSQGCLSEIIISGFTDGKITKNTKMEFTYDTNFTLNRLAIPLDYWDYLFYYKGYVYSNNLSPWYRSHMITSMTLYSFQNNIWSYYTKANYYYSTINVTGITDQNAGQTTIFPNPTTDYLNINWNGAQSDLNLELFDITGKKLLNKMVSNHSKLSIMGYPVGLYLVRISDANRKVHSEKVYFK